LEQEFLRDHISGAHLEIIESYYGHDGFLLEFEAITTLAAQFLREEKQPQRSETITLKSAT
jgi:homoserine O-acetyltransferase